MSLPHNLKLQTTNSENNSSCGNEFKVSKKNKKDFVCCGWFLLHSTRYAKDFALRNKVIILSGALTYSSSKTTNNTNQGAQNQRAGMNGHSQIPAPR